MAVDRGHSEHRRPGGNVPSPRNGKVRIGWKERVDFADWGVRCLKAKVDTGAKTSALHVEHLEHLSGRRIRFNVIVSLKPHRDVRVETRLVRMVRVRNSAGHMTKRPVVAARVRIGPVEKRIEVTLVSRMEMTYRMLLGREALAGDFTIDPARGYRLDGKRKGRR